MKNNPEKKRIDRVAENPCRTARTVKEALSSRPGIVHAEVDAAKGSVVFDYDSRRVSDQDITRIAREIAPVLHEHFDTCLLRLRGRACEACALKLERKARKIEGIHRATATFLGGVMSVTFDHDRINREQVVEKIRGIGAPVQLYETPAPDTGRPGGVIALFRGMSWRHAEILFSAITFVFMILGWLNARYTLWPLPPNVFYLVAYIAGGYFGVLSSYRSLRQWTIDIDLLMVLAALGAAYVGAPFEGAMLLFLFSLSNVLQGFAIDRTRKAITSLMKLRPQEALARRDGKIRRVPIEELEVGDHIMIRPGDSIPLDGNIVEGESEIDQSSLTGESMPVGKRVGDQVFAATINQTGSLEVRVTRRAHESTIAKLIRMVEEAQSEKAETQRFLERAEQYYALAVILFTLGLIFVPLGLGTGEFEHIFYRAMTVMVVASPCALIISTPASILSAIGGAARRGILFKGGAHLEQLSRVRLVAFDKTGTLTTGRPRVTDVWCVGRPAQPRDRLDRESGRLLALAASVESRSEHVVARSIVEAAQDGHETWPECRQFHSVPGRGAIGQVDHQRIAVGNMRFFEDIELEDGQEAFDTVRAFHRAGKTAVLVASIEHHEARGRVLGVVAVSDELRPDARDAVLRLKQHNRVDEVVMLTGDHEEVAAAMANESGVDSYYADLLPEDKVQVVKKLRERSPTVMVGDGVNDAPALASASVGMAMGAAGTDVAMETADIVLMSNELHNVPAALALSRRTRRIIIQNLVFAMSVIVFLMIAALGYDLPLTLGVIGHEGSTVIVCLNGLRLLANRDG